MGNVTYKCLFLIYAKHKRELKTFRENYCEVMKCKMSKKHCKTQNVKFIVSKTEIAITLIL